MNILLDTNIIMDALQERAPFDVAAKKILQYSLSEKIQCCFTANTITDIFYIYSKAHNPNTARSALSYLLSNYKVISVAHEDCIEALSLPIDDFEDALIVVCAAKEKVDYIVTRDEEFLQNESPVPLISPSALLEKIELKE